jgi:hypothetical protein
MELPRIPGHEQSVKHSFAFKQSTTNQLQQYQAYYESTYGAEIPLKDLVEHMLLNFMAKDKGFQKHLRAPEPGQGQAPAAGPAASSAGASASAGASHGGGQSANTDGDASNT